MKQCGMPNSRSLHARRCRRDSISSVIVHISSNCGRWETGDASDILGIAFRNGYDAYTRRGSHNNITLNGRSGGCTEERHVDDDMLEQ